MVFFFLLSHRLRSELESYRNAVAVKNAEIKMLNEHVAVLKNSEEQLLRSSELREGNESTNELRETLQKQMKKNEVSSYLLYKLLLNLCTDRIED